VLALQASGMRRAGGALRDDKDFAGDIRVTLAKLRECFGRVLNRGSQSAASKLAAHEIMNNGSRTVAFFLP
jgi:hypothetical protein